MDETLKEISDRLKQNVIVFVFNGKERVFIYTSLTPATSNQISSVEFNTIVGMEITNLINKLLINDQNTLEQQFLNFVNKNQAKTYKFSKNVEWYSIA